MIFVLLSFQLYAMDLANFKAKCFDISKMTKEERNHCAKELNGYCTANPPDSVKQNCAKIVTYFQLKEAVVEGPNAIAKAYSTQKFLQAELGAFSTDLAKIAPSVSLAPRGTILAISEQCSKKYGQGKTAWNSYQLHEAGKASLSSYLMAKKSEVEALIRKHLPSCPDPKKQMSLLAITWLPEMQKPTVYRMTESKDSRTLIQDGVEIPDLK